jgi:hypothetical protein
VLHQALADDESASKLVMLRKVDAHILTCAHTVRIRLEKTRRNNHSFKLIVSSPNSFTLNISFPVRRASCGRSLVFILSSSSDLRSRIFESDISLQLSPQRTQSTVRATTSTGQQTQHDDTLPNTPGDHPSSILRQT